MTIRRLFLEGAFTLAFFVFLTNVSNSQLVNPQDSANPYKKLDTISYKLAFVPNDTLIYRVNSFDSITINFDKPLMRNRVEHWQIVCKSIDNRNRYVLGIKLIDYKAKEKIKGTKEQEVFDSPWINHEVIFTVDSLGDRYYNYPVDSSLVAMGPGGAFQPILLIPFLRGVKPINQTWIVNSTDTLLENGFPLPLMKQVSLFKLNPIQIIDGDSCASLEYVKTGQGVVLPSQSGIMMNVTSVINSYGELYLSLKRNLPIKLFTTVEQKLTIMLPGGDTDSGFHYIASDFTLESYKKFNGKLLYQNPKLAPKIKKKSK
jgi:hypothetical protein